MQDGFLSLPAKEMVPKGMGFDCSFLRKSGKSGGMHPLAQACARPLSDLGPVPQSGRRATLRLL